MNVPLRDAVLRILPRVKTPAQYTGGELHSVAKDHRHVRGRLCLCFPDAYTIGMSHHGLQVLYTILNNDPQWACERAFTPWPDFERELRTHRLPLYGLESFTPLCEHDVVGFSDTVLVGPGGAGGTGGTASGLSPTPLRAAVTELAPAAVTVSVPAALAFTVGANTIPMVQVFVGASSPQVFEVMAN